MFADVAGQVRFDQRLAGGRIAETLDNRRLKLGVEGQHRQPLARRTDPPDDQPAQVGPDQFDQPVMIDRHLHSIGQAGEDRQRVADRNAIFQQRTQHAGGLPVYAGTAKAGELALGDGQSVVRGVTGPEFLNFNGPAGPTNLFTLVRELGNALQGNVADPAQAARDALGGLDAGLESVTTAQTVVGSRMNWIDLIGDRRTQRSEQRSEQQAEVGGADLATTVTALQEIMTVLEASQAAFARLAGLSLVTMLR